MVIGASLGAKLVMLWGTPSSRILKFSFFSPGIMSPFTVVAITSSVTTGTSTEMVTPASSGFFSWGGAAFWGGFVSVWGGAVDWGPSGIWAAEARLKRRSPNTTAKDLPK